MSITLTPLPALCERQNYLAKTSIFAKDQRLLEIADMLEEVFSHDIALDGALIERIKKNDEHVRNQLVDEYSTQQRLFFDFRRQANLIVMSARIYGQKRLIVFFDRNNIPLSELKPLGFDLEMDSGFLTMGYYLLPEWMRTLEAIAPRVQQATIPAPLFKDPIAQAVLEDTVRDAFMHMRPDIDAITREGYVNKVLQSFRTFTPRKFFQEIYPRLWIGAGLLIPVFLVWMPIGQAVANTVVGTSILFLYLMCINSDYENESAFVVGIKHPWFFRFFLCFLGQSLFSKQYGLLRVVVAHESMHILALLNLVKKDVPTANAYETYLDLLSADSRTRSEIRADGLVTQGFYATMEDAHQWGRGLAYGLELGLRQDNRWQDVEERMVMDARAMIRKGYDESLGGLAKRMKAMMSWLTAEPDYTFTLGEMYGTLAYTYARRAADREAGFEFIRLMSQGASLEKIVDHLHQKYRLAPIESLRQELMPSAECCALFSGSA